MKYLAPEFELMVVLAADVIATSQEGGNQGGNAGGDGELGPGDDL